MKLEFGYGKGEQIVEVPDKNLLGVLVANELNHERRGAEAVDFALAHPIGAPLLSESVKAKKATLGKDRLSIAIIVSDISRPVPSFDILPSIVRELLAAGCDAGEITVVFALGSHRGHTDEEKRRLAGDYVFETVRCVDSDPNDCIHLGETACGTPVDITRSVAEADYIICTGNIEFHYFAGYSGGYKAIMPGVSTPAAIQANHRMMVQDAAHAGNIDTNPIRQDIEEAGRICGADYMVNVVLDEHKHIVYAVAGDMIKAHRDGCAYLDKMYRKPLARQADIVLVSQGGAPKDANLYQVQKALDNSKHAVRNGGRIILIGACNEGFGSKIFEEWFKAAPTPESMIKRINEHFQLGGHKAAAVAMVMQKADIDLVSEMDDDTVRSIFMTPRRTAQEAFDAAMEKYGPDATVIAMPFGGATLPMPE
ncbi:MAG: nickel-dependent lactate racemase [Lachnospiraceae bacterium]|nr:nickel-dependent lactate racemase [Lachnospiraceae bacterium]